MKKSILIFFIVIFPNFLLKGKNFNFKNTHVEIFGGLSYLYQHDRERESFPIKHTVLFEMYLENGILIDHLINKNYSVGVGCQNTLIHTNRIEFSILPEIPIKLTYHFDNNFLLSSVFFSLAPGYIFSGRIYEFDYDKVRKNFQGSFPSKIFPGVEKKMGEYVSIKKDRSFLKNFTLSTSIGFSKIFSFGLILRFKSRFRISNISTNNSKNLYFYEWSLLHFNIGIDLNNFFVYSKYLINKYIL